ncbi:MAG: hypothetical protein C5S38_02495 [Candidatus Methanophagaceae archaeon]|nr:MAG: hypothetical protein C5S38_02495 [Methanophagales archaeon]
MDCTGSGRCDLGSGRFSSIFPGKAYDLRQGGSCFASLLPISTFLGDCKQVISSRCAHDSNDIDIVLFYLSMG